MRRCLWSAVLFTLCLAPISRVYSFEKRSKFEAEKAQYKVLVFLSESCPCSGSHVTHINELALRYKDTPIYGVITDEFDGDNVRDLEDYYSDENFQIPLIKDEEQVLVKKYRALKTPHSVILSRLSDGTYKILYEGGVSDSKDFSDSKKQFLRENLEALFLEKPLRYARGRSLGCYIRRL